jgi:hypothetical protein
MEALLALALSLSSGALTHLFFAILIALASS